MADQQTTYKEQAARAAVDLVQPGMLLGLGHGSTLHYALLAIAEKIKSGELSDIQAVPASSQTEAQMREAGIPLASLEETSRLDLTIDGADEVDPNFNLVKGGGGALLREKLLAQNSRRLVIVVDESKLSPQLGARHPLPIEVAPFGWQTQIEFIAALGGQAQRRVAAGEPVRSDQGNYLLDCHFGPIEDLHDLARKLEARSGILEHGLFLGLTSDLIVAGPGGLQHHEDQRG